MEIMRSLPLESSGEGGDEVFKKLRSLQLSDVMKYRALNLCSEPAYFHQNHLPVTEKWNLKPGDVIPVVCCFQRRRSLLSVSSFHFPNPRLESAASGGRRPSIHRRRGGLGVFSVPLPRYWGDGSNSLVVPPKQMCVSVCTEESTSVCHWARSGVCGVSGDLQVFAHSDIAHCL